jgi:hypothetical protein
LPFNDVPRPGPVCGGPSGSTTVPTPGFLTPSPVSWLDRARGFVSPRCRPWALVSLQSVPLASGRAPLVGAAGSLAVRPGRTPVRRARSCHLWPSPTRATFGRRPWPDPAEARGSLSAPRFARPCGRTPRDTSRSPWTSHAGLTSVRSFRRLRSVLPCANPVHTARRSTFRLPCARRPVLSWASSPLQSLAPAKPGALDYPPRPEASLLPLAPRASRRVVRPRGSPCLQALLMACATSAPLLENPRRQVASCGDDRSVPHDPSADTGSVTTRAVLPFGSSLDSHDLRCASEPAPTPEPATLIVGSRAHQV